MKHSGILDVAAPVIALRPKRGYSATNLDGSPAIRPSATRCQFGPKYDAN